MAETGGGLEGFNQHVMDVFAKRAEEPEPEPGPITKLLMAFAEKTRGLEDIDQGLMGAVVIAGASLVIATSAALSGNVPLAIGAGVSGAITEVVWLANS